mmetsp:Transcript_165309/g.530611  ORF Transcript_165309/g.530611 Transcript_165309/m.530611 type:complete len:203 (+) Transcript_165309:306-914(+)
MSEHPRATTAGSTAIAVKFGPEIKHAQPRSTITACTDSARPHASGGLQSNWGLAARRQSTRSKEPNSSPTYTIPEPPKALASREVTRCAAATLPTRPAAVRTSHNSTTESAKVTASLALTAWPAQNAARSMSARQHATTSPLEGAIWQSSAPQVATAYASPSHVNAAKAPVALVVCKKSRLDTGSPDPNVATTGGALASSVV